MSLLSHIDYSVLVLPASVAASGAVAMMMTQLSRYLAEKTHASRMSRVVDVASRVAADIALTLAATQSGDMHAMRDALLSEGVAQMRAKLPDTLAAMRVQDADLSGVLSGELAKAQVAAPTATAIAVAPGATAEATS